MCVFYSSLACVQALAEVFQNCSDVTAAKRSPLSKSQDARQKLQDALFQYQRKKMERDDE